MTKINFFTPVRFEGNPTSICQRLEQGAGSYFFFGGKAAYVTRIGNQTSKATLQNEAVPLWKKVAIIVSFALVLVDRRFATLPIAMLLIKTGFYVARTRHYNVLRLDNPSLKYYLELPLDEECTFNQEAHLAIVEQDAQEPIKNLLPPQSLRLETAVDEILAHICRSNAAPGSEVLIPTNGKPFSQNQQSFNFYLYDIYFGANIDQNVARTNDEIEQTWMYRISQALREKGLIQDFRRSCCGYHYTL